MRHTETRSKLTCFVRNQLELGDEIQWFLVTLGEANTWGGLAAAQRPYQDVDFGGRPSLAGNTVQSALGCLEVEIAARVG